jgi:hypothetical protein
MTGFIWIRTGTSGWFWWLWWWIFKFFKILGIYLGPDLLSPFQKGLNSTDFYTVNIYVVTRSDSLRGFILEIGFIDHFNTWPVTKSNYSAIADFHILPITTAHAKSFQSAVVSTSRSLVTASSESGDSSTAPTKSSLHKFPCNSVSASTA